MGMAYGAPIRSRDDLAEAVIELAQRITDERAAGVLYRVEAVSYAAIQHYADPISGEGEWYSTGPRLELFAFPVQRWTEHGATLFRYSGARPKWVDLRDGAKQWASRTGVEAVAQFADRRKRQIYIIGKQMQRATRELDLTRSVLDDQ